MLGLLWAGVSNDSGVVVDGNFFGDFGGYTSSEMLEIRPSILYGDMLPIVGR